MNQFDATEYFNQRAQEIVGTGAVTSNQKSADLALASTQKIQELAAAAEAGKQQEIVDKTKSWVGKAGLDPNSLPGEVVNAGAHLYSGASNLAGNITGLLSSDLPAVFSQAGLTDTQKAAVSRYIQGRATPDDKALINHVPEGQGPDYLTPLKAVQQAAQQRQRGQNIRDSFNEAGDAVHSADGAELEAAVRDGFDAPWDQTKNGFDALWNKHEAAGTTDLVSGVAKLVYNAGKAAVDHPAGALGYMAENAPQLALGAAGKVGQWGTLGKLAEGASLGKLGEVGKLASLPTLAELEPGAQAMMMSNIGYASDYYQKGLQNYAEQNNGAIPDDATQNKMAAWAASLALAEHAGQVYELKHAMGAAHAAEEVAQTGLIQGAKNIVKAAVHGGAEEMATEGYQGFAEGQASLTPVSAQDIYEQGVVGGLVGAGLSGGGRAVGEATKTTPEHVAERTDLQNKADIQQAAVATGDVSKLVDPKLRTYDPANAVAALHGNSFQEGTTPETQQANLQKANAIVADLEQRHSDAKDTLDATSPEVLKDLQDRAAAALAQGDTQQAKDLQDAYQTLSKTDPKVAQKRVDDLQEHLDAAHERMASFHEDMGSVANVKDVVQAVSTPVDESNPEAVASRNQAVESLINLSMASPERLDGGTATALAEDKANGLTDDQREYLSKFAEARASEGSIKDVSQQVFAGGNGNVGIAQYRSRIAAAIAAGNQAGADAQMAQLAKFNADHAAKADAVAKAWEQGKGTQVIKPTGAPWMVSPTPRTNAELKRMGGMAINSPALVTSIQNESRAIAAAHKELAAAYALKFSTTPKGTTHVQDVSQALDKAQNQPAADATSPAVGSPATSAAGSAAQRREPVARPGAASTQVTAADSAVNSDKSQASADAVSTAGIEGQNQYKNPTGEAAPRSSEVASETGTSPQSAEQTSEQSHETAAKPAGQLAAMDQKSPEGIAATARNLIADFFTQTISREGDRTERPLVKFKDFLSSAFKLSELAAVAGLESLTDAQHNTLQHFQASAKEWASKITSNLVMKKNPDFRFEDLMQFLMEGTSKGADVEENVKTAISYVLYAHIADNATKSSLNTAEEINAILGRDENDVPSEDDINQVGHIGVRQNVVINGMGQKVAQALGLTANSNAYQDLAPRLHSALGARVMALGVQLGMLEVSTINGVDMAVLRGESLPTDPVRYEKLARTEHPFIKLARQDGELHPTAQAIFEATRGSQSVLDKVFGAEAGLKDPVFDAGQIEQQRSIRNTRQKVPAALDKIIAHENQQPNFLRQDMWHLISGMAEGMVLRIAGSMDTSPATMHKANRLAQQAKNDGLARELDNIKDFIAHVWQDKIASPIFFEHTVWKQQRVGIANNTVNPQTSKIHRHMLFRPDWVTKIDPTNPEQMDNFRLRVLEGLGVKTDKQANTASLAQWGAQVTHNAKVQAAVAAIKERMAGADLTDVQQEAIASAAKSMHALDALVALAKVDGNKPFETHLMGEVDGVTNGPMLTHMALGANDTVEGLFNLVNKGGFFQQGSEHENYNVWRGQGGNNDLYETTAKNMTRAVQALLSKAPGKKRILDAIYAFSGELVNSNGSVEKAGRDIVKTPLTAMVFGSAVEKSTNGMGLKFIDSIYSKIEAAAKAGDESKVKGLVDTINTLLGAGGAPRVTATKLSELMEHQFTQAQVKGLLNAFNETLGKAMQETMKSDFENFISKRRVFNHAAQLAFDLHNAVYTALRDQFVEELRAKGELPTRTAQNGVVETLHDLTSAQEAELRKRLAKVAPVLATQFSSESGSLASALSVSKSGRKLSQNGTYTQNIKFASEVAGNKSVGTHGYETRETNPGVAMLPMSIHSLDSFISHTAAMLGQVLNIHDAHGAGVGMFEQTARNLNQATWKALLEYSPAGQMAETLSRTVQGLAEVLAQKDLPASVHDNLQSALETMSKKLDKEGSTPAEHVVATVMENIRFLAKQADSMKLEALSQMQSVDQYALEGGQYTVTEEDRAAAEGKRQGLTTGLSDKENAAIDAISNALASGPASSTASAVEEQTSTDMEDAPQGGMGPFGPIGKSQVQSDPKLVALLQKNPSVKEVIKHLYDQANTGSGRTNAFNAQLLRLLAKTVSSSTTIQMVTPDMTEADVLAKPIGASRGWFVAKDGSSAIYVLSPEFQNSGLTAETLLHELTHGALAQVIARELAAAQKPGYKSEALDLINELQALREKAQAYAQQQGITGFEAALGDIQEFIAWGMTSQAFQRQVISQVSVMAKAEGNSLVNGMKKFITNLVGILFKGSTKTEQEQAVNGLTSLVSNVSGLFNQVGREQQQAQVDVNQSMASNPVGTLNTYSTLDIHEALNAGSLSLEFDNQLRNLLGGIVEKLHGTFGSLKASLMKDQALTPFDVWQKALATGVAPFASSLNAAPMAISERERHAMEQVEVTVREAIAHQETSTRQAYRELRRLYDEMHAVIKPSDFKSQAEYDFVFAVQPDAQGKSEHLARFAAFGLANEQFNQILAKTTVQPNRRIRDGRSFAERFQIAWEQVLEFFHGDLVPSLIGQRADSKLEGLVGKLVDVEARKRTQLATPTSLNLFDQTTNKLGTAGRQAINAMLGSQWVKTHKNPFVRAAGAVGRITANQQVMFVMDALAGLRDKHFDETYGIAAGYLNELRGPGQILNALQLASTAQQRERQARIDQTSKFLTQAFVDGNKMAKQAQSAVTKVFLRTGMHALIQPGRFNMAELEHMLDNTKARNQAISTLEAELSGFGPLKDHYILHANDLAYFTVTGKARRAVLMSNAHNIARVYDKLGQHVSETQAKQAQAIIEQLIPLYSIEMQSKEDIAAAKSVLRTENTRTEGGNGVEFVMALHKRLEDESRDKLFEGQEALMGHGYVPEILNPHTEIKAANDTEGEELRYAGYSAEGAIQLDPADPDQEKKRLYVLRDGGLQPQVTGSMSYTGRSTKGSTIHSGFLNVNTTDGATNASTHNSVMQAKMNSRLDSGPRPDLTQGNHKTFMVPVVNPQGQIVNWRYMMNAETKDNILERNSSFADVLGALAGSIYDKHTTPELNNKVVQALKDVYKAQYFNQPKAFVRVGPGSTDPELVEKWRMLPDSTRDAIKAVWGRDGMLVRKDALNSVFGYRKQSLADIFKKDPDLRNGAEKVFAFAMEHMLQVAGNIFAQAPGITAQQKDEFLHYSKRAAIMATRGERIWQGIVREAKDIIVVKSGVVMLGNIKGNFMLLAAQGVGPKAILSGHLVAMRGARDYQANTQEIAELQAKLDTNTAGAKAAEYQRRIALLRDAIARNPVKKMIDLGLMPTIEEDVGKDDPYAYQNYFTKKVDELKDKAVSVLPEGLVSTAKNIYMAKDTAVYQGLSRITQLSDFAARYVLFKHLTERAENPLSEEDATFEASEAFVNYDIPMHKSLQYMDDMGFLMFIKYFMRMQRVLIRTTKENPGRVLTSVALHHFMGSIPSVLESSWITRVGHNPFSWGALQFPSTLLDLGSVSSAMRLIR